MELNRTAIEHFGTAVSGPVLAAAEAFVASPLLSWSVGPMLASFVGFSVMCVLCEWITAQSWAKPYLITYDGETREDALGKTHKIVSWRDQLWRTFLFVGGPYAIVGFYLNSILFPYVIALPQTPLPSMWDFATEFFLLMIAADFFLYWAHRAAHEVPFLWEFHKYHHLIRTPTAVGTAYISTVDAFVHAGPPMSACALVVRPHPVTYSIYIGYHLGNAALNHSGLDWWPLNLLAGKLMPLRTLNAHHDAHHRYSNRGHGATNLADVFWVWDRIFGTAHTEDSAAAAKPKAY